MEESGSSKEDDPPPWRPPGGAFRPYNASESSSAVDAPTKSSTGKTPVCFLIPPCLLPRTMHLFSFLFVSLEVTCLLAIELCSSI